MPYTIRYHFSQHFAVPAKIAYEWCTDYRVDDPELMHETNVKREITRLNDSTQILKETLLTSNGKIEKQKLVNLYPEHLFWVSTHLSGPNKHSQFIYWIKAEDKHTSHLDFNAFHIHYQESVSGNELKLLTDQLCGEDSKLWKLLAETMEKELNGKSTKVV